MTPFDALLADTLAGPPLAPMQVAAAFLTATVLGAVMAFVYQRSAGRQYNPDIAQAQIMLAALMAMVMLVVSDNLSRAFGAVGILGVMRFRIKMNGAAEAMTLMGAVVVGMAAGVGMYRVAVMGALLLSLLTLVLSRVFEPRASEKKGEVADDPALE